MRVFKWVEEAGGDDGTRTRDLMRDRRHIYSSNLIANNELR